MAADTPKDTRSSTVESRPERLSRQTAKRAWRLLLSVTMLLLGIAIPGGLSLAADSKSAWQADWDKIVIAAKKEGRLNFYVGRYGSEKLLNEFRKEFPEIRIVTTNGAGNSLGTPNAAKVFINWFLTRRGQTALQRFEDLYGEDPPNSRRVVAGI